MNSNKLFTTESLDLATYLVCMGNKLTIYPPADSTRVIFGFAETPDLIASIVKYERGTNDARRLLTTRSRLYREASAIAKGERHGN